MTAGQVWQDSDGRTVTACRTVSVFSFNFQCQCQFLVLLSMFSVSVNFQCQCQISVSVSIVSVSASVSISVSFKSTSVSEFAPRNQAPDTTFVLYAQPEAPRSLMEGRREPRTSS